MWYFQLFLKTEKNLKFFDKMWLGKKCFSITKSEQKFTSMAFTQEIKRRINFGLLKRVNGTCSMAILNKGQEHSVWQVIDYISKFLLIKF